MMYGEYYGDGRPENDGTPAASAATQARSGEIGRFLYKSSDFTNNILIPALAGNINTIVSLDQSVSAVCYMPNDWTANHQAMAGSLGNIPIRVIDQEFSNDIVLIVKFYAESRNIQAICNSFSDLLKGMSGQNGVPMSPTHYQSR